MKSILKIAAIAAAFFVVASMALAVVGAAGRINPALVTAPAALAVASVLPRWRWDRDATPHPESRTVRLADLTALTLLVASLLVVQPRATALFDIVVMDVLVAAGAWGCARVLRGYAPTGGVLPRVVDAWCAGADSNKARAIGTVLAGAAAGYVVTLMDGSPLIAGAVCTLIGLVPAVPGFRGARRRDRARADVSRALAGTWKASGAARIPWSAAYTHRGISPARITRWDGDTPTRIEMPVPPERLDTAAADGDRSTDATAITRRVSVALQGQWTVDWDLAHQRCTVTPLGIPEMAPYPDHGHLDLPWNRVAVGVGKDGPVTWDLDTAPHCLVAGPTGTGKSVLQRALLFHALARPSAWRVIAVDPKKVELGWLRAYPNVMRVETQLEPSIEVVRNARDEMMRRYEAMEAAGVNHAKDLPDSPPALLVMIDETYNFLAPEGVKSDEGKERDALHAEGRTLLGEIARLGRAAKVHLCLATQRPDVAAIPGELKANLDFRAAAGRMDSTPSLMVLDSDEAKSLPKIKGRGLVRIGGELREFQGYFATQDWYDTVIREDATRRSDRAAEAQLPGQANPLYAPDRAQAGDNPAARDELDDLVPTRTFADVGGYEEVKQELRDVLATALDEAEVAVAQEYGLMPGGVVLYGPPGTGKSHLAEAAAGEFRARFVPVSVGDLTGPHVGEGAQKIREAVDTAIRVRPSILLIEEIDAIAGRRESGQSGESRANVNEVLVQLDYARRTPGVVVMATTNDLARLDRAVIRDGRMSKRILIGLPDEAARASILDTMLRANRRADVIDTVVVAKATSGFTAATLGGIVETASTVAKNDGLRNVVTQDLLEAIKARGGKDRPTVEAAGLDGLVLPESTVRELRRTIALLRDPSLAAKVGIKAPTGLLLEGPGGTGKTSIARALAAEAGMSFRDVKPGEWTSRLQGESERQVREVFEWARENAPSIVFLDEVDSIGGSRGEHDSASSQRILTPLLAEMDGFGSQAAGGAPVFVVGASNRADTLDTALTRPGRLSRTIHVGLPDEAGRAEILRRATAGMQMADGVDLDAVAAATDGMSPAELIGGLRQVVGEILIDRGADTATGADWDRALEQTGRPAVHGAPTTGGEASAPDWLNS